MGLYDATIGVCNEVPMYGIALLTVLNDRYAPSGHIL